ncbi:MAG: hypothetical protein ACFBSD_15250 [Paracoccaceae bacterium]
MAIFANCVVASGAEALSIITFASGNLNISAFNGGTQTTEQQTTADGTTDTALTSSVRVEESETVNSTVGYTAEASVDAGTGTLRSLASSVDTLVTPTENEQGNASSQAVSRAEFVPQLLVSGTGTLTALFAIDVIYDVQPEPRNIANPFAVFTATLGLQGVSDEVFQISGAANESVDDLILSASREFTAASNQVVNIEFRFDSTISGSAVGTIDALASGTSFFTTTSSLVAEPTTPGVFADPAFIADTTAIPIPATLPLLAGALGLGALVARRR